MTYGYISRNSLATRIGWAMAGINLLILGIEGVKLLGQSFLRQSLLGLLAGLASLAIGLGVSFRKSERYSRRLPSPIGSAVVDDLPDESTPPADPTVS